MRSGEFCGYLKLQGQGRGKLLLFGEHAAVYGYPAVGVSLPFSVMVGLTFEGEEEWSVDQLQLEDRKGAVELLRKLEKLLPSSRRFGRGKLEVLSEVPRAVGFGSSAAFCVALVDAFFSLPLAEENASSTEDLWRFAHELERQFHGTPSGIDTGLASLGGLRLFKPRPPDLPQQRALPGGPVWIIAGAVKRISDTKSLVSGFAERIKKGEKKILESFERLGSFSEEAAKLFESGDPSLPEALGQLADQAHMELAALGLSTQLLEEVLKIGKRAGALGGKLSGAGGGGAFYLVAPDEESSSFVKERLQKEARDKGIELQGLVAMSLATEGLC